MKRCRWRGALAVICTTACGARGAPEQVRGAPPLDVWPALVEEGEHRRLLIVSTERIELDRSHASAQEFVHGAHGCTTPTVEIVGLGERSRKVRTVLGTDCVISDGEVVAVRPSHQHEVRWSKAFLLDASHCKHTGTWLVSGWHGATRLDLAEISHSVDPESLAYFAARGERGLGIPDGFAEAELGRVGEDVSVVFVRAGKYGIYRDHRGEVPAAETRIRRGEDLVLIAQHADVHAIAEIDGREHAIVSWHPTPPWLLPLPP